MVLLAAGAILLIISYSIDNEVSLLFKDMKFPIFDVVLSTVTNFGVVALVMLGIPLIIFYKKDGKLARLLLLAFCVSVALAFLLKLAFLRQRPVEAFTYPFTSILNYSFPSMHAMAVFALLPILSRHLNRQKSFWIGFGLLAVLSRIYFGFHFLSDVVFGALLGYFIGSQLLILHERGRLWK